MDEVWKEYDSSAFLSNKGRVLKPRKVRGGKVGFRISYGTKIPNQQSAYYVFKNEDGKSRYVGREVYKLFIDGTITQEKRTYYIDGNSLNNNVNNLLALTKEERQERKEKE